MLKQPIESLPREGVGKKPATFGEMIFGHVILFVACVALPAFVTAVAPLSTVKLMRSGEGIGVSAKVSTRLLFLVPYKVTVLEQVTAIGDRYVEGHMTERRPGDLRTTRTEDEAFLMITGTTGEAKVPVSPVNIRSVEEQAEAFLKNPAQRELKMTVIANWKFGALVGGFLSLLTVFYIYLQISSVLRAMKRLLPG